MILWSSLWSWLWDGCSIRFYRDRPKPWVEILLSLLGDLGEGLDLGLGTQAYQLVQIEKYRDNLLSAMHDTCQVPSEGNGVLLYLGKATILTVYLVPRWSMMALWHWRALAVTNQRPVKRLLTNVRPVYSWNVSWHQLSLVCDHLRCASGSSPGDISSYKVSSFKYYKTIAECQ